MDSFYLIVLAVATIILILLLAFLGWNMSNAKKGEKYPTITTSCPDNWTLSTTTADNKVQIVCTRPASGKYNFGGTGTPNDLTTYMTTISSVGYNGVADATKNSLIFTDDAWSKDTDTPNPVCAKKKWASKYGIKWDSIENANYC